MPSDLQILPTPSPEEFLVTVRVPDRKFNPSLVLKAGVTLLSAQSAQQQGKSPTTFAQFMWAVNSERVNDFGNYVYLKCEKSDPDHIRWFFGRAKTSEQRNTPFSTFPDTRQYTWPAVLEDLFIIQSSVKQYINTGSGVEDAPRYLPRYRYRPAVPYNSTVIVRQYLSDVPWAEIELTHEQPVPTDINGSYIGLPNIDFQRCLHDAVRFRETTPGAQIVDGIGQVRPPNDRALRGQVFPPTNFIDWQPFFIEDRQQQVDGLWLRESIEIHPPLPPEPIYF